MRPLAEAAFALVVLAVPVAVLTVWMLLRNRRDRRAAAVLLGGAGQVRRG